MLSKYSISVIVPIYNEKSLIETSVTYINSFLRDNFSDYEIIIIESGSTDGSAEICDQISKDNPKIKLIHEGSRNGFGSALKIGYRNAVKDLVWLVTVDLPFSLDVIFKALPLFDRYDCILSYRIGTRKSVFKRTRSFVYNYMIKILLGLKVRHVNSAFKIFKRDIVKNIKLISSGWFLDAEILYRFKKSNIKYIEIPVPMLNRQGGVSSISLLTPLYVLKELFYFLRNKDK